MSDNSDWIDTPTNYTRMQESHRNFTLISADLPRGRNHGLLGYTTKKEIIFFPKRVLTWDCVPSYGKMLDALNFWIKCKVPFGTLRHALDRKRGKAQLYNWTRKASGRHCNAVAICPWFQNSINQNFRYQIHKLTSTAYDALRTEFAVANRSQDYMLGATVWMHTPDQTEALSIQIKPYSIQHHANG